ncbi:MAG: ImmA/IrrE family metallo-endopeptidase [Actinomyces succiniciruminis]|nr:ImmA/IrrE family metallo-endopeptidase [Actinomyces succiniciruminis]
MPEKNTLSSKDVKQHARRLLQSLRQTYPDVYTQASDSPIECLRKVVGLNVIITDELVLNDCSIAGDYDGIAARITIYRSGNLGRDAFTAMHEFGHHLLYLDENWQYKVAPNLKNARAEEEKVVNAFAGTLLVSEDLIANHLVPPVTANGIHALAHATRASLSACCMRALEQPGERLIMLASTEGRVWFSVSNSDNLLNPGRGVIQPLLADVAQRAGSNGTAVVEGGAGLRYASGRAWTAARVDARTDDDLVIAVITAGRQPDPRLGSPWVNWSIECPRCGSRYTPREARGTCSRCGQAKCPQCGACECPQAPLPVCKGCGVQLGARQVRQGVSYCEFCE